MESLIRDKLVKHMTEGRFFSDAQHGFVPGRSCMTQLLVTLELWTAWLDKGESIDAMYLNFKKAFDSVPHLRLLHKLKAYGRDGNLCKWIEHFLLSRKQRVVVNGKLSDWITVLSGIPQGSVLGTILFVIFINDLPELVLSTANIFADDTKLFHRILSPDDHHQMQEDLNRLVKWSDNWKLGLNEGKCKVLHLGNYNPQLEYQMKGTILTTDTSEKDLGVTIDKELKFHQHIASAVKKASRMLGLVKATFTCLDGITVPRLFTAMVRPHMEYGNVIWSPRYISDCLELEKLQRRATKLVPSLRSLPYEERIQKLRLPSLIHRRRRGDMMQVYQIMSGIDRVDPSLLFTPADYQGTRGHSQKCQKQRSRLDLRHTFFSQRVVQDWKSLPEEVVSCNTLNCYKSRLDRFWRNEQYKIP